MNLNFTPVFKRIGKYKSGHVIKLISSLFIVSVILVGLNQYKTNQLASANCSTQSDINMMVSNKSSIELTLSNIDYQITENNNNIIYLQESLVTNHNNINSVSSQLSNYSDYYIDQLKKSVDARYNTYMRAKSVSRKNKSKASLDLLDRMIASYKTTYENTLASYNDLILKRDELKQQLVDLDNEKMVIETQVASADAKTLELNALRADVQTQLDSINSSLDGAYNNMCPTSEINCNDGMDDDKDGGIDCSDGDCSGNSSCNGGGDCPGGCINGQVCISGMCQQTDCYPSCQSGYSCDTTNFTCVPNSDTCNPSCSGDQTCVNNTCVDIGCPVNGCPTGQVCSDGKCLIDPDDKLVCGDNKDNDGDGYVDESCEDGVYGTPECTIQDEGVLGDDCSNGCDDDGDQEMDCEETMCNGTIKNIQDDGEAKVLVFWCDKYQSNPNNLANYTPIGRLLGKEIRDPAVTCQDGGDNDNDGDTDCDDPDCSLLAVCNFETGLALCSDGIDNDWDNSIDCADAGCFGLDMCKNAFESACFDGVDNDFDGSTDCSDSDCDEIKSAKIKRQPPYEYRLEDVYITHTYDGCSENKKAPYLETEVDIAGCSDGVDNDGDGKTDTSDDDC